MTIDAMLAEVERRLDDPARPPMQLRTEPLTEVEKQHTLASFQRMPTDHQDRLLSIFEDIVEMPEPEHTRAIEFMHIAIDVVLEQRA